MNRKAITIVVIVLMLLALPVLFALLGWWDNVFRFFGG
jgi:hypothetical protein